MNVLEESNSQEEETKKLNPEWIVVEKESKPLPKEPYRTSTGASTGGLSELSKQLRILQAKNQAQLLEIDRLQRQLRILADLENISVADLREALAKACEAEAYGEMHSRVATLRAELEAVALVNSDVVSVVQPDTSHKVIANLELRVGELEELDEKHRGTIELLYSQLKEQQASTAQVESLCEQLRRENEQLKLHQQNTEIRSEASASVEQDLRAENVVAMNRARDAEMEVRMLSDKLKLCEQQLDSVEKESSLRNAQSKARFMVQDENIEDLRQQLSSLYVAFEMLKEEKDRDDARRISLQTLLGHADAEVARQVDEIDQSNRSVLKSPVSASFSPTASLQGSPQEKRASITSFKVSDDMTPLMSGDLLIKASSGVIKKWKKHHVSLFATVSHFHLDIGEEKGYAIQIGVSRIELYPKYPYAFTIYMGGRSRLTLLAAATNQKDFDDWISMLTFATTGKESVDDEILGSSPMQNGSEHSALENSVSTARVPTLAEQEESDLELALEMSQRELKMEQSEFV